MKKWMMFGAVLSAFLAFGAGTDVDGNAITGETLFGDVDGAATTVGDVLAVGGFATTNDLAKATPADYETVKSNAADALTKANAAATADALTAETARAQAAEQANADAIAKKADASALDDYALKSSLASLASHTSDTSNPHKVTAAQVGAYTKAETDEKIASATPGDYETVSNKAYSAVQTETDPTFGAWTNSSSIVAGRKAKAAKSYSIALGEYANAVKDYTIAIGGDTTAEKDFATALGYNNFATGDSSTALGYNNFATGQNSTALGYNNTASGKNSTALGYNAYTAPAWTNALAFSQTPDQIYLGSSTTNKGKTATTLAAYLDGKANADDIYTKEDVDKATNALSTAVRNDLRDKVDLNVYDTPLKRTLKFIPVKAEIGDSVVWTRDPADDRFDIASDSSGYVYNGLCPPLLSAQESAGTNTYNTIGFAVSYNENGRLEFVNGYGTMCKFSPEYWGEEHQVEPEWVDAGVNAEGATFANAINEYADGKENYMPFPITVYALDPDGSNYTWVAYECTLYYLAVYTDEYIVSDTLAKESEVSAASAQADAKINAVSKQIDKSFIAWTNGTSIAAGSQSLATSGFTTAIGRRAKATGSGATALGQGALASGDASTAIGSKAETSAYGINSATASGKYSTAIGIAATASGNYSTAIGYLTEAQAEESVALGNGNIAGGEKSVAIGLDSYSYGVNSVALGKDAYTKETWTNVVAFAATPDEIYLNSIRSKYSGGEGAYTLRSCYDYALTTLSTNYFYASSRTIYSVSADTNGISFLLPLTTERNSSDWTQDVVIRLAPADTNGTCISEIKTWGTYYFDYPTGINSVFGKITVPTYFTFTKTAVNRWSVSAYAATKEEE